MFATSLEAGSDQYGSEQHESDNGTPRDAVLRRPLVQARPRGRTLGGPIF